MRLCLYWRANFLLHIPIAYFSNKTTIVIHVRTSANTKMVEGPEWFGWCAPHCDRKNELRRRDERKGRFIALLCIFHYSMHYKSCRGENRRLDYFLHHWRAPCSIKFYYLLEKSAKSMCIFIFHFLLNGIRWRTFQLVQDTLNCFGSFMFSPRFYRSYARSEKFIRLNFNGKLKFLQHYYEK